MALQDGANAKVVVLNTKCTEEFSPPTRTEALLLDEALASVALLNEVRQSCHILVDLGIPICKVSSEPNYYIMIVSQPWYSLLARSVCSRTSKIENSPPAPSSSTTALGP